MQLLKVTSGEWTALFDTDSGELLVVGDSYLADKRIDSIYGVKEIYDDAFLDEDGRCAVGNYQEYEDRRREADDRRARAIEAREQAAALLAEAEELEKRA